MSRRNRASRGSASAASAQAHASEHDVDIEDASDAGQEKQGGKKRVRTKSLYTAYLGFLNKFIRDSEQHSVQFADLKRELSRDNGDQHTAKLHEDFALWEGLAARIRESEDKPDVKTEIDALKNSLYVVFRDAAKNEAFEAVASDGARKYLLM